MFLLLAGRLIDPRRAPERSVAQFPAAPFVVNFVWQIKKPPRIQSEETGSGWCCCP